MILGTGIDLVEVERIRHSLERFGDRFLKRILCPEEIVYCVSHRDLAPFVAGRFAAKEAISKAFGTGIGTQIGWHDLEVAKKESGEPFVRLHGMAAELFKKKGGRVVHLSLTHTKSYASAIALLEGSASLP
jgi:holo-[acyl-carrier protein] synthase